MGKSRDRQQYLSGEDRAKIAKEMLMKKGMVTPLCADCGISASKTQLLPLQLGNSDHQIKVCLPCLGKREAKEVSEKMKVFQEQLAYAEKFEDYS